MLPILLFALIASAEDTGLDVVDDGPCQTYETVPDEEVVVRSSLNPDDVWDGGCYLYEPDFRFYPGLPPLARWFPGHYLTTPLPDHWHGELRLSDWTKAFWSPTYRY